VAVGVRVVVVGFDVVAVVGLDFRVVVAGPVAAGTPSRTATGG